MKRKKMSTRAAARKPQSATARYTAEYRDYLKRYEMLGEGRPRLSPAKFDRLDEELLDLLGLDTERGLSDEEIVRLQELEYLLLYTE